LNSSSKNSDYLGKHSSDIKKNFTKMEPIHSNILS